MSNACFTFPAACAADPKFELGAAAAEGVIMPGDDGPGMDHSAASAATVRLAASFGHGALLREVPIFYRDQQYPYYTAQRLRASFRKVKRNLLILGGKDNSAAGMLQRRMKLHLNGDCFFSANERVLQFLGNDQALFFPCERHRPGVPTP